MISLTKEPMFTRRLRDKFGVFNTPDEYWLYSLITIDGQRIRPMDVKIICIYTLGYANK